MLTRVSIHETIHQPPDVDTQRLQGFELPQNVGGANPGRDKGDLDIFVNPRQVQPVGQRGTGRDWQEADGAGAIGRQRILDLSLFFPLVRPVTIRIFRPCRKSRHPALTRSEGAKWKGM